MAWSSALESTILGRPDLASSSRFLQTEQNFFNYLITVLWSTAPSHLAQKTFLVISPALWLIQFKIVKN